MEVKRAGFNYRHSESFKIDRPRGSGDYLLLIIKTEAFAVLEGKQVDVPASSAIVYKKGSPQLYGAVTDKFINDWVHFDLTAEEEERLKALSVPFDTVIPLREGSALSGFIKSIVFERYSQNPRKKESADMPTRSKPWWKACRMRRKRIAGALVTCSAKQKKRNRKTGSSACISAVSIPAAV